MQTQIRAPTQGLVPPMDGSGQIPPSGFRPAQCQPAPGYYYHYDPITRTYHAVPLAFPGSFGRPPNAPAPHPTQTSMYSGGLDSNLPKTRYGLHPPTTDYYGQALPSDEQFSGTNPYLYQPHRQNPASRSTYNGQGSVPVVEEYHSEDDSTVVGKGPLLLTQKSHNAPSETGTTSQTSQGTQYTGAPATKSVASSYKAGTEGGVGLKLDDYGNPKIPNSRPNSEPKPKTRKPRRDDFRRRVESVAP